MHTENYKVLEIIKTLDIGGAERFGLEISRAFSNRGMNVTCCVFFQSNSPIEKHWEVQLASQGIETFFLADWKGNNSFINYITAVRRLLKKLDGRHFNICHSHFQLGTLSALFLRHKNKTDKVIRTAHNLPRREWQVGWYGWFQYNIIGKWIYPLMVDVEVCVSQYIKLLLEKHPGAKLRKHPIITIYNSISPELIQEANRITRQKNPPGKYSIGSVGRLTEQKGYPYLLKAMPEVLSALPDTHLTIVGDGELRSELESISIHLDIDDHVTFSGRLENVIPFLRHIDLFVLPSLWEGLPTVILESMACQTAVVATRIPGTQELIINNQSGWIIPPADSHALAQAILFALRNEQKRLEVTLKATHELDRFNINHAVSDYISVFDKLVHT